MTVVRRTIYEAVLQLSEALKFMKDTHASFLREVSNC